MSHRLATIGLVLLVGLAACNKDDNPSAPQATIPASLAATWNVTAVEFNGTPADVATILDWDPDTVSARIIFSSGGDYTYREFDAGASDIHTETGTVEVDGSHLVITILVQDGVTLATPEIGVDGSWAVTGDMLAVTVVDGSDTIVLHLTRM